MFVTTTRSTSHDRNAVDYDGLTVSMYSDGQYSYLLQQFQSRATTDRRLKTLEFFQTLVSLHGSKQQVAAYGISTRIFCPDFQSCFLLFPSFAILSVVGNTLS